MKFRCLLLCVLLLSACKRDRVVNTSFYYWKTIYKSNTTENAYLKNLHVHKLYIRIMDVDMDDSGIKPVPVSPILFQAKPADSIQIIPVVFIVNNILRDAHKSALDDLAKKITSFVNGKLQQAGRGTYNELQIDCDWTATTRDNYFYLLKQIAAQPAFRHKKLSATLRLHQLKNRQKSGVPPVSRVMLMCYNMGNLRKYGNQNSILEVAELKKYAGDNIADYPIPVDLGLPLFSWAVAFRDKEYTGLSKRIKYADLLNKNQFIFIGDNLYKAVTELPQYGLQKGDEIRWETSSASDLQTAAKYLSPLLKQDSLNLIYFHLNDATIKPYTYETLENISHLLH